MPATKRKLVFILAASDHGTMIVSRFDYHMVSQTTGFGVGLEILESGAFDPDEVSLAVSRIAVPTVIAHPFLPPNDQEVASLERIVRAARMAAKGLRPLRRPIPTMEHRSA